MISLEFKPLVKGLWSDFEQLFGPRGAYGGCWCMWWRLTRKEFEQGQGEDNHASMKAIVDSGEIPGILAYHNNKPIGWCSVAPREKYGTLERSRVLKRLDEREVWSIVCFHIAKDYRNKGVASQLIQGAIDHVKNMGGKILEAYPTQPRKPNLPPVSSYMGIPSMFAKSGFKECARPSKSKVIMRYYIE